MQVSDLGPDNSTMEMDLDDVLRMTSNSSDVTDGISAAFTAPELVRRGANRIPERIARLVLLDADAVTSSRARDTSCS